MDFDAEGLDDVGDGLLAAGVEHPVLDGAVVARHRVDEGWNDVQQTLIPLIRSQFSVSPTALSLSPPQH